MYMCTYTFIWNIQNNNSKVIILMQSVYTNFKSLYKAELSRQKRVKSNILKSRYVCVLITDILPIPFFNYIVEFIRKLWMIKTYKCIILFAFLVLTSKIYAIFLENQANFIYIVMNKSIFLNILLVSPYSQLLIK